MISEGNRFFLATTLRAGVFLIIVGGAFQILSQSSAISAQREIIARYEGMLAGRVYPSDRIAAREIADRLAPELRVALFRRLDPAGARRFQNDRKREQ